ncbi:unnamed protein product [Soboliphyme baturini]|uniref:RUN domain-containing protein n=1 Tax=Soboliphyme baturini TaxID=241478 RepID=A0A183IZR0_9BILA|nr:unnamed protein product [Soboliphyme baturini]
MVPSTLKHIVFDLRILENLQRIISLSLEMAKSNAFIYHACIDEISLEGFDGITLNGLWKRLDNRPGFGQIIDSYCKQFLWQFLRKHPHVKFYELKEPRKLLQYDSLRINVASDKDVGVWGSCADLKTRCDITDLIKSEPAYADLESVTTKFSDTLVIVASLKQRVGAMVGHAMNDTRFFNLPFLSLINFAILERVGR